MYPSQLQPKLPLPSRCLPLRAKTAQEASSLLLRPAAKKHVDESAHLLGGVRLGRRAALVVRAVVVLRNRVEGLELPVDEGALVAVTGQDLDDDRILSIAEHAPLSGLACGFSL